MKNRMKMLLPILFLAVFIASCFEDAKDPVNPATLNITVTVDSTIWGYPMIDPATETTVAITEGTIINYNLWAYNGVAADDYTWHYPTVESTDATADITLYKVKSGVATENIGGKNIVIYLYSALGTDSESYPVLYRGESDGTSNPDTVTITDIVPGDYYVVAFYDYRSGGDQTNILNRYDRYAIYTSTANSYNGSDNSTPYVDKAEILTLAELDDVSISLSVGGNWIIGEPKIAEGDTGRIWLDSVEDAILPAAD